MWLGDLVHVLEQFGLNERLVRTCINRLSAEGWFVARRQGRRSIYSLSPQGLRRFQHAYKRVYAQPERQWDGSWTIVFLPRKESLASIRDELRRELEWEGFGIIAPNVFGHPSPSLLALRETLQGLNLEGKVFVMSARSLDVLSGRPLNELIAQSWNLLSLARGYREFTTRFAPLLDSGNEVTRLSPAESFVVRTLLIHWFRRVTLCDPQFPGELLPADWLGHRAYDLCRLIYQSIYRTAEDYLRQTVESSGRSLPEASPWFYQRFGGLS